MVLCLICALWIQSTPIQSSVPSPAEERLKAYTERLQWEKESPLKEAKFQQVGPTEMGGRVVDVVCFSDKPTQFWVAYASGGLWRTDNMGSSWQPLFDRSASITIGDIAISPHDRDTIWVGTGEKNSSRSSYAGTGIYRSNDGGENWVHMGLSDTHHISRILIDPKDSNRIYVAAIGHLYSENEERGVFRSLDGGTNWEKVLYLNDSTGIIDLAMDPFDANILLAGAWERHRQAWNFEEGGDDTGLYRSVDGGTNWELSSEGLPLGINAGRIGVAFAPSSEGVVYLTIDNQRERAQPQFDADPLARIKVKSMSTADFLAFDDKAIDEFLKQNHFHKDYTAEVIRKKLSDKDINIQDLMDYMIDGNAALFDRQVMGVEVYVSADKGQTWIRTHEKIIEDFAYSYGYYFGEIVVDPKNEKTIYITGVPLLRSIDGGQSFENINEPYIHVDHHALWIDANDPRHLLLGNDGGVDLSWDGGSSWHELGRVPAGQFYTVATDMAENYSIYGGLQDNGVWRGKNELLSPQSAAWTRIGGGDGAYIEVDPRDNQTVYLGLQFGHYQRKHLGSGEQITIYPRHKLKEAPYRFNWMTPIELSSHHHDVLYMGCQKVLRSLDRGASWSEISEDLTNNPKQGDIPFGTITVLKESKKMFGTLVAGTDDGRLWKTKGGSPDWQDIGAGLPQGLWVSGVEISPHDDETLFVTLTGYRNDDFRTYVFKSKNGGQDWVDIHANLPQEACNVVREDVTKAGLLFLGTDIGLWVSFDEGMHWAAMASGLPHVPVYALEVHERDPDLIVATHGRSIFTLDITDIRQLDLEKMEMPLIAMTIEDVNYDKSLWGSQFGTWWGKYSQVAEVKIPFYTSSAGSVEVVCMVDQVKVHQARLQVEKGLQYARWDFSVPTLKDKQRGKLDLVQGDDQRFYLRSGKVEVKITQAAHKSETAFEIKTE